MKSKNLKKKMVGLLDTNEKVRKQRTSLENATKDALRKMQKAKFRSWAESHFIILD